MLDDSHSVQQQTNNVNISMLMRCKPVRNVAVKKIENGGHHKGQKTQLVNCVFRSEKMHDRKIHLEKLCKEQHFRGKLCQCKN